MKKIISIEGIVLILAGYYALTHDYIYDSLVGASVNISVVQLPIGISLILAGIVLIVNNFKKS